MSRSGCSTNAALFISYLSKVMDEMDKAVLLSLNTDIDATDYITNTTIKEGVNSLKFLNDNNNINSKEDVLAYTHRISENIDILGTGKDLSIISENFDEIFKILSMAYDYIILDVPCGLGEISINAISSSSVVVVCLAQDKYICQNFIDNSNVLKDKKSIILISQYDAKKAFLKSDSEVVLQREVFTLSNDVRINQSCYEKNILSYLSKKSNNLSELDSLYKEVERLINIDTLNVSYNINEKLNNEKTNKVIEKTVEEPIKVVKEYKFIKAKNNIGIINLSEGAGSTFVTLNLACLLKEKKLNVTVAEIPYNNAKHDIYSIINCDNEIPCIIDGIKYYINNDDKSDEWTDEKIIEYINSINKESTTINLYDLGNMDLLDNSINYLLNLLDCCIVVVDPLPYKLLQANYRNQKILDELKNKGVESIYTINKFIDDLNKKDIENYLNCKAVSCIPFIKPTTMYTAHYASKNVYKIEKNELLKDSLLKIVDKANIAVDLEQKSKSIFNIFRKE